MTAKEVICSTRQVRRYGIASAYFLTVKSSRFSQKLKGSKQKNHQVLNPEIAPD